MNTEPEWLAAILDRFIDMVGILAERIADHVRWRKIVKREKQIENELRSLGEYP